MDRSSRNFIYTMLIAASYLAGFAFPSSILAAPVAPEPITLTQPDGTPFTAVPFGDEWQSGYEHGGYTILQEGQTGYWHYARLDKNGRLSPTTTRVGQPLRQPLTPHLRSRQPANQLTARQAQSPTSQTASGSHPVLIILVDFTPSASLGTTAVQWHNSYFNEATKSVKAYYQQASYGHFTIEPASESHGTANDGVIEVTLGYAHPNSGGSVGSANLQLVHDALTAANPYIDYSSFDSNGNSAIDNSELHLVIIPRGFETAVGGSASACAPNIWGHQLSLSGSVTAPTLDGVLVADSSSGGSYLQFGEWHETKGNGCQGNRGNMATIGVMVHEFGHDLNWPDLYDTDGSSSGVGNWSVMGVGNWGYESGEPLGTTPVLPDPFSKIYQGWLTPTEISSYTAAVDIPNAATNSVVYQLGDNPNGVDWLYKTHSGSGDYFLLENRQQVGFDAGLQRISANAAGCLIWHIDESANFTNLNNNDESHKHIDVEEADGVQDLDSLSNNGDTGDPWPGSSNNLSFTPTSTPNSYHYDGSNSGVRVTNISTGSSGCRVDLLAAPTIQVVETAVSAPQLTDSQTSHTLTIANNGSYDLTWSLSEDSVTASRAPNSLLHDNGPFINSPGTGAGGADESLAQASTFNMVTLGFNNGTPGERVADQFTITDLGGWQIDTITFYTFQTNSSTSSNINSVNLRIWDGPPNSGSSNIIFGDTSANRLASSSWHNSYRAYNVQSGDTSRPIMANVVTVNTALPPGSYWLDWQTGASAGSAPDVPPITITGQTTTGDALGSSNNGASWSQLIDSGSSTQQGLPFQIMGSVVQTACSSPTDLAWLSLSDTAGTTSPSSQSEVEVTLDSTGLNNGRYSGTLCIESNDLDTPLVTLPVTLDVCTAPSPTTITNIAVQETAVFLTWADAGSAQYEVWFAANDPYFTPAGDCASSSQCQLVAGLSWTHDNALSNPDQNYSYQVKTAVACGNSTLAATPSNRKATFSFSLATP